MRLQRALALVAGVGFALAMCTGAEAADAKKKTKKTRETAGVAGVISTARGVSSRPKAIDSNDGQGYYCTLTTPNVHYLGTLPPDMGVVIDFESSDTSDPIAILTTLKMEGLDVGAETGASDDEGGNLNPRFEFRRPYWATIILAVASADEDEACYAYRMRLVP